MATTENLYTGDGSTVLFSFTFPYISTTHIKVSLDGVPTTEYILANATTIQFNTAPAVGVNIRIYRNTASDTLEATFYPGSSIRAQDLNNNFLQTQYVAQELQNNGVTTDNDFTITGDWNFTQPASGPLPVVASDYVTKAYADAIASAGIGDGNKGDITVSGGGTVWTVTRPFLESSAIGTTVQPYDADTAKLDQPANFTSTLQNGGNNVLTTIQIGATVQPYDVNTAKLNTVNTWTGTQSFQETVLMDFGAEYVQYLNPAPDVAGTRTINLLAGNVFGEYSISGNTTFVFANPPAVDIVQSFMIILIYNSGTITWPATVKWRGNAAPNLTPGHAILTFLCLDGGSHYLGNYSVGYPV